MNTEKWKECGVSTKFPTYRNSPLVTEHSWQQSKRKDDGAEGLWRIHDGLYDFTEFIDKHPGGSFWIRETQGMDITEAFEAHHLSTTPEKMIHKYKVRDAVQPRIYTLTLHEDGFYRTLKGRVREKLKTIDMRPKRESDLIHLGLLLSTYLFAVASVKYNSLLALILASVALCWTVNVAHNYFHRRDNWQMYTFNLAMLNFCSWRIAHSMSHHIYPNTFYDLELTMFEPFFCWIPSPYMKSKTMRYLSWILEPFVYPIALFLQMATRIFYSLRHTNIMYWHDLLPLSLPLVMYCGSAGSADLLFCIRQWIYLTAIASFAFCVIALHATHHNPESYHEGDKIHDDRDWGLFQVSSVVDRADIKWSRFLVITHFGDHVLHHLFPTLDHGLLPALYPILYETLDQFKAQVLECKNIEHIIGQHKQLLRIEPKQRAPGAVK
ncbi:cytochrome b5-related protein-like [Drosophila innubila]|uniref:cytochrome b5-related protein-like n=1 Tax=Drosophila innubila TaxID=198719 RepID=UPI00148DF61A|nr:cytochrome b5-related protein-like [Drosophila innubila]